MAKQENHRGLATGPGKGWSLKAAGFQLPLLLVASGAASVAEMFSSA